MFVIGPQDTTQNFVFDEGKYPYRHFTCSSPQNVVGHDMIENIEFPSFLINSPEVKNECISVNIWSLETLEGSMH